MVAMSNKGPTRRPTIRPALIKNKAKRAQVWAEQKAAKRKDKREARAKRQREVEELGEAAAPRKQVRGRLWCSL